MYPSDRRYSKDHEWVALEGETARLGITQFAQHELGDIVFVELPEIGRAVKGGETLGTVESVKAVSEIYAPVSGVVVERNDALSAQPELVNTDPHGSGWYCKLQLSQPSELDALLDADAYARSLA